MEWDLWADQVLGGKAISRQQARTILEADEDDLLPLLHASFRIRRHTWGRKVILHRLRNARSGTCPEDCSFCSQSISANSGVEQYKLQTADELVQGATEAIGQGAITYCMVTSTRGPSESELEVVLEAVERIKQRYPLKICTSLGLLTPDQARRLAAAGVDRFNHNLESSRSFFPSVCSTHSYDDRIETVKAAHEAGMEACCGGIIGMGETLDDRVDLAFELADLGVESIPVNFLDPREGTPLAEVENPTPEECLKTLAMFRFVHPTRDLRVAGGREVNLRQLQSLALFPANSIFTNGYLTTPGTEGDRDRQMIQDAGFEVVEPDGPRPLPVLRVP